MSKLLAAVGILFLLLAVIYFSIPANELAGWIPGADPNVFRYHYTHAAASLVVGIGLLGYAGLRSRKR